MSGLCLLYTSLLGLAMVVEVFFSTSKIAGIFCVFIWFEQFLLILQDHWIKAS